MVPSLPYQIIEGVNDTVSVQVTMAGKVKTYTATELVGIFIVRLKSVAESALGVKVEHAVIGMPPDLGLDPQHDSRTAVKQAVELAGLSHLRIIQEPMAASIAYGLDILGDERNIVVYDMGGEMLRVTVLICDTGVYELVDTVSLPIGGRHFNERVAEW